MEKCLKCNSDTELFIGGVPICLKCLEKSEAKGKAQSEAGRNAELANAVTAGKNGSF